MTTFAFPSVTPNRMALTLETNTERFVSPFTGSVQTQDRGGEGWAVSLSFFNLRDDDRGQLIAFLAKLIGQTHRFTLPVAVQAQRGSLNGTPLVAGAGQTGTSINIDGATPSQTNWIRAGDWFSIGNRLKMATADASSDAGGNVTIEFVPRFTTAPGDNAPVEVAQPVGVFMLANDVTWAESPGGFSDLQFEALEDIL